MNLDIRVKMDDAALAPFRAAWNHASANEADIAGLTVAAREHHADLSGRALPAFLRPQIDLIPEIADLLSDPDWQVDDKARRGLTGALAYFNDPRDLIPDSHPVLGLFDDAIVIELALAENHREWLAWQEFAALRAGFADLGPMNLQHWTELRLELPRILHAQRRGSYVESRFAPADRRSRYRMLNDLPQMDMN